MQTTTKILLLLLLVSQFSIGQTTSKIDSLKNILSKEIPDSTRVLTMSFLGKEYHNSKEKALPLYKEMLKLAESIDNHKLIAHSYLDIATVYYYSSEYEKALAFIEMATVIYKEHGETEKYMSALNNMGILYRKIGDLPKALDCYQKRLTHARKLEDHVELADIYNNMANLYSDYSDLEKAMEYQRKSIFHRKRIKDNRKGLASNYNNVAMIFSKMGNLDSTLNYYRKAFQTVPDKHLGLYGNMANNLGVTYKMTDQNDSAFHYLYLALENRDGMNYYHGMSQTRNNLANLYYELGEIDTAFALSQKALEIAQKYNYLDEIELGHKNLALIYEEKKDFEQSLYHLKAAIEIKDSLRNKNKIREVAQLEMSYAYEQEKITDSIQNAKAEELERIERQEEEKRQKVYLWSSILGGVLLLVICVILFQGYRSKSKANLVITQKSEQIQIQKENLEEKNNEITDSLNYAKRIQATILPDQKVVEQLLPKSFVFYQPKDIVSGDFYWIQSDGDKTYVAAADCTGHGVPGAMVSVVCSNALSKALKEYKITEPSLILDQAHKEVIDQFKTNDNSVKDGMDIALCALHSSHSHLSLQYAGANNPLWIITSHPAEEVLEQLKNKEHKLTEESSLSLIEVKPDKIAIGQHDINEKYTQTTLQLKKGDRVYLFSDGFADQFGGDTKETRMKGGKKLKSTNFKKLLLSIQDQSMAKQKDHLELYFSEWRGELEQIDDVCVIGVRL